MGGPEDESCDGGGLTVAMLLSRVTLVGEDGDAIALDSTGPASGYGWGLASASTGCMEGWWTAPAPRAEAVERPQADGAFAPLSLLVGARVLTVVAHHRGTSPEESQQARDHMASLTRGWVRIVVEEATRTSHVRGFLSSTQDLTHVSPTRSTHSLIFTCPDPTKYWGPGSDDEDLSAWEVLEGRWAPVHEGGLLLPVFDQATHPEVTSTTSPTARFTGVGAASSLLCENRGNQAVWPVLEVDGPISWARWVCRDHVVQWASPVAAGSMLRINSQDGSVDIGGVRVMATGLTHDDFFQLPPGTSTVAVEADREATLRVRWLSGWT